MQTWDSKINSLVAAIGGAADLLSQRLQRDGRLRRFQRVVQREYRRTFPAAAPGQLALPCQP